MPTTPLRLAYLRRLFEMADVGVAVADNEGRYVDVNVLACELFGRPRDEIIGQTVALFIPPADAEAVRAQWEAFLRDGHQAGVFTLHRRDGTTRRISYHARANFTPGLHCSFMLPLPDAVPAAPAGGGPALLMCAWTKQVQVDGQWMPIEEFLRLKLGLEVNHGMSPEARDRMMRTLGP